MMFTKKHKEISVGKFAAIRFNIMVVGETGSGKTTFIKTLFRPYVKGDKINLYGLNKKTLKTVKIEEIGDFKLSADNVDCDVHLYDSVGYGDSINNEYAIESVKNFLKEEHDNWLDINGNMMSDAERNQADGRIHCLFYFIAPHRVKDIDTEFLKELWELAPIVPVIAKSDTMTVDERRDHLLNVKACLDRLREESGINRCVNFLFEEENDEEYFALLKEQREAAESAENVDNAVASQSIDTPKPEKDVVSEICTSSPSISALNGNLRSPGSVTVLNDSIQADSITLESNDYGLADTPSEYSMTIEENPMKCNNNYITKKPLPMLRNIFAIISDYGPSGKRIYPWGELVIDNEDHSDFRRLQRLIFEGSHIVSLRSACQELSIKILNSKKLLVNGATNMRIRYLNKKLKNVMSIVNHIFALSGWVVVVLLIVGLLFSGGDIEAMICYYSPILTFVFKWLSEAPPALTVAVSLIIIIGTIASTKISGSTMLYYCYDYLAKFIVYC